MKKISFFLLLAVTLIGVSPLILANSAPSMVVLVTNGAHRVVFKGKTDKNGMFATEKVSPGSYVVQFNSKGAAGGAFDVVINAGKKKVTADSVPASKFSGGGVAMKVEIGSAMSLVGQVAPKGQINLGSEKAANNAKVKYINGKKYVWVPGEMGSNLGGRWVDANSPEARNVTTIDQNGMRDLQDRTQPPPPSSGR